MTTILLLLVAAAAAVTVTQAWPQGQPNCALEGNWTDPEGTERMSVASGNITGRKVHQVVYNSSGFAFSGSSQFEDGKSAALRVSGGNESLILNLVCQNKVMWIMQTPLHNSTKHMRVFTLTRLAPPPPPQPPILPEQDAGPPDPNAPPRFVLVNITIPERMKDDDKLNDSMKKDGESKLSVHGSRKGTDRNACTTCPRRDNHRQSDLNTRNCGCARDDSTTCPQNDNYGQNDPQTRNCGCARDDSTTCPQNDNHGKNDPNPRNCGCARDDCTTCPQNDITEVNTHDLCGCSGGND